jgi:hypothetical protein
MSKTKAFKIKKIKGKNCFVETEIKLNKQQEEHFNLTSQLVNFLKRFNSQLKLYNNEKCK